MVCNTLSKGLTTYGLQYRPRLYCGVCKTVYKGLKCNTMSKGLKACIVVMLTYDLTTQVTDNARNNVGLHTRPGRLNMTKIYEYDVKKNKC